MIKPKIFGQHDEKTLAQLYDVASRAARTALMADGHVGYTMPIGGVAAYHNQVSVVGVGLDIGCGNCAIKTNRRLSEFSTADFENIANEIQNTISFGMGRSNHADDAPVDHPLFESPAWEAIPRGSERDSLRATGRNQLGTVGSGNHYVDVFADEEGNIWVGVHFGSRGLGYTIAQGFLSLGQGKLWGQKVKEQETLLRLDTPLGQDYWASMVLAGEHAYAGREWVARKILSILGGTEVELVHNHHNFAWKEIHDGQEYVVIRKGATPAFPGQRGFVGGSMGDNAVILEGSNEDNDLQRSAMYSTVHGAGRVMSRMAAKGKHRGQPNEIKPLIRHDEWQDWIQKAGVVLRGGDIDEAPQAYRRLPDVLAAQGDTVNVLHTLKPVVVVMAGKNEHDPYKD